MEETIKAELSHNVDEVSSENLVKVMTSMIPLGLSKSFRDCSETRSRMGNTVHSALARLTERGHLNSLNGKRRTRIWDNKTSSTRW